MDQKQEHVQEWGVRVCGEGTGRVRQAADGSVVLGTGRFQRHSRVVSGQSHTCKCHSHDPWFPLQACV